MDTRGLSAGEITAAVREGTISCEQVTRDALARIESENGRWNAFLTVAGDQALSRAKELDRTRPADAPLPAERVGDRS